MLAKRGSPPPNKNWRHDEVQVVDEAGIQTLPNGGHASAETDVTVASRLGCPRECGLDATGDEM